MCLSEKLLQRGLNGAFGDAQFRRNLPNWLVHRVVLVKLPRPLPHAGARRKSEGERQRDFSRRERRAELACLAADKARSI